MFNYLVGYFPISIRKTAELNPSENYLIVNHPHGILSVGAFGNFLTDATSFSSLFPGIRSYLCTLDMNFYWPIRREYMQLLGKNEFVGVKSTVGLSSATSGAVSRSKESVSYLITRPGGGNAVVIVAGGAEEALESQPGAHRIILRERKGFVKVAIKYGCKRLGASFACVICRWKTARGNVEARLPFSEFVWKNRRLKLFRHCSVALVPSYSFGEVDLFRQVSNGKGSTLRSVQSAIGSILTFTTPLFYGRGAFGFRFGFLPFQRPVCTVVGCPIEVERNENPTREEVNRVHDRYISELVKLFESHKCSFGISEKTNLQIL
ncbi:DAGAT domain containing protein [Trichuris trichiura]|uniref:Acyltransferase n=1 Tax=Trichuris trichiura TaxID=36087 RepID=A0A077YXH0_TRITR|nr:DAGAT domain containing protein [Trichuris trichiura]